MSAYSNATDSRSNTGNDSLGARPKLLGKRELCAYLGLSARHLENLVRDGRFPPPKRLGRFVYWTESAATRWLNEQFAEQESWEPTAY